MNYFIYRKIKLVLFHILIRTISYMPKNEQLKIAVEKIKISTGLKQAEIAEQIGIKSTYLSDMINGRVPLTENICQKIFELFHISILDDKIEEIIFKEAPLYYGGNVATSVDTEEQYQRAIESGLKMLPEVDFVFSAGQASLVSSGHISRFWHLPDCEDCEAVAPMVGNSMLPTYPPGCELVFKRYTFDINKPNTIVFGNVFGVVLEDTITGEWHGHIKILRRHKDHELAKNYWIAHSINSDEFDDFDIEIKQVRGLWIVKKHMVTNVL